MKVKNTPKIVLATIWRHKYLWTIALFVAYVGFLDDNSYMSRRRLAEENQVRQNQIDSMELLYNTTLAKLHELKTNPHASVRVAREIHQMRAADEDVYYFVYTDAEAK